MRALRKITEQKKQYLPLLLLADPCEAMIDRYLERSDLYLLEEDGRAVAVAVVAALGGGQCELKNIAVEPALQGRGYGSELLRAVLAEQRGRFSRMLVGTTLPTEPFYRSLGFRYSHTVFNFFVDNYPEPIFEGNTQCVDMRYLCIPIE